MNRGSWSVHRLNVGPRATTRGSLLLSLFLVAWGVLPLNARDAAPSQKVWIIIHPVQCMGNPWEKEWLAQHKNQVDKYPRRTEFNLMKRYFRKKGVDVLEMRVQAYDKADPLCKTCDCPRGDTVYVKIPGHDVSKMVGLGYIERAPANDPPAKKK